MDGYKNSQSFAALFVLISTVLENKTEQLLSSNILHLLHVQQYCMVWLGLILTSRSGYRFIYHLRGETKIIYTVLELNSLL